MRAFLKALVVIPVIATLGLAVPAGAQVSVNLDALNPPAASPPTQGSRPATRPTTTRSAPPHRGRPATTAHRPAATAPAASAPAAGATAPGNATAAPSGTRPAAAATGAGATATGAAAGAAGAGAAAAGAAAILALPSEPPASPVISEPPAPPPVTPPAKPATSATAGSTVAATPEGLRVVFAAGKSDLTPESASALTEFAKKVPPADTVSLNVVAFAAGTPEDPSTARRLSLSRALAIRTSLMAEGIASMRIYVRAMGVPPATDAGPPDRVDITVLGANSTQAATQPDTQPSAQPGVQAATPAQARP